MKKLMIAVLLFCMGCTKEAPNISIHISEELLESFATDAETYVESVEAEDGEYFITLEANDGAVDAVMSREKNEEYLARWKNTMHVLSLSYVTNEDINYTITGIDYNDDCTEVIVTVRGNAATSSDLKAAMVCSMYAEMYQLLSGIQEEEIKVTAKVISESGFVVDKAVYPDDLDEEE